MNIEIGTPFNDIELDMARYNPLCDLSGLVFVGVAMPFMDDQYLISQVGYDTGDTQSNMVGRFVAVSIKSGNRFRDPTTQKSQIFGLAGGSFVYAGKLKPVKNNLKKISQLKKEKAELQFKLSAIKKGLDFVEEKLKTLSQ